MSRIEALPKSRYRVYLKRALEFAGQMDRAASDEAWNAVGLLGVHSVISACDALTVGRAGQRWSGQDHARRSGSCDFPGNTGLRTSHPADIRGAVGEEPGRVRRTRIHPTRSRGGPHKGLSISGVGDGPTTHQSVAIVLESLPLPRFRLGFGGRVQFTFSQL